MPPRKRGRWDRALPAPLIRPQRGRPGESHCGSWTPLVPEGYWTTRVVCSQEPGHDGRHSNPDGYSWTGDEIPERRSEHRKGP